MGCYKIVSHVNAKIKCFVREPIGNVGLLCVEILNLIEQNKYI